MHYSAYDVDQVQTASSITAFFFSQNYGTLTTTSRSIVISHACMSPSNNAYKTCFVRASDLLPVHDFEQATNLDQLG
jgi:hypothetical protein